jgi:ubiquinone/menaquinone biosynthesis C-methylase UbiE
VLEVVQYEQQPLTTDRQNHAVEVTRLAGFEDTKCLRYGALTSRSSVIIQRARSRAPAHGLAGQIDFIHADVFKFCPANVFDAVIGRYILPHVVEPAGLVRHMARLVRSGGLIVLHEVDFGEPIQPWPYAPLWDRTYQLLGESFRRMG